MDTFAFPQNSELSEHSEFVRFLFIWFSCSTVLLLSTSLLMLLLCLQRKYLQQQHLQRQQLFEVLVIDFCNILAGTLFCLAFLNNNNNNDIGKLPRCVCDIRRRSGNNNSSYNNSKNSWRKKARKRANSIAQLQS